MASWSTTFQQTIDDIIPLYRNMTGRENPTLRERQLMDRAVNEAMQKICVDKYGTQMRFLLTDISVATTSGTDYVDLPIDTLYVLQGTVTIPDEDRWLRQTSLEYLEQLDAGTDVDSVPQIYAFEQSSSGANYIRMKLFPTPDAAYTITAKASQIIAENDISNLPNYLHGPLLDMATYIAMKRIGFGNPALYKQEAEDAIEDYASQEASDGPLHIPRRQASYGGQNLEARKN